MLTSEAKERAVRLVDQHALASHGAVVEDGVVGRGADDQAGRRGGVVVHEDGAPAHVLSRAVETHRERAIVGAGEVVHQIAGVEWHLPDGQGSRGGGVVFLGGYIAGFPLARQAHAVPNVSFGIDSSAGVGFRDGGGTQGCGAESESSV